MSRTHARRPGDAASASHRTGLGQWWLDRSVPVKGLIALSVPLLALIAVTGSAFILQLEERGQRQDALAANRLVLTSMRVLQASADAETGIRGYAATGDRAFLSAYNDGLENLEDVLPELMTAATAAAEQAGVATVNESVNAHRMQLFAVLNEINTGSTGAELSPLLSDAKDIMDRLRSEIRAIASEADARRMATSAEISNLENQILRLQIIGLTVGLLTGAAGVALFSSGIARRIRLAAANADRLGTGQAVLPTKPATDEIGRLDASMATAEELLNSRLDDLATARDQALTATRTKNSFLSRTSHELRTPLNAILGFAQLLELADLDAEDRESAVHIHQAGRHLLALINELIDISRVESGDLQVSMEPISVARVSHEVVALVGPLAAARQIVIDNRITDGSLAVAADYQRLKQVLVNLVSNAIKYNRHAGRITLDHRRTADRTVELRVTDTGQGLSAADAERIWMPFERLDADKGGIEGTGIGLPLARALTEAMQGTLDVESIPGVGSTFSIRLSLAPDIVLVPDEEEEVRAAPTPRACPLGRRLTVLSVEDNMANSQVLERIFRTWSDVSLLSTGNAEDGLRMAVTHRPDLILLDLHLPGMTGEEAFQQLRSDPATVGIPVVVLSADATPGTVRRLLARGASAYLTKPLDLASLYQVLEDVTHRPLDAPVGSTAGTRAGGV